MSEIESLKRKILLEEEENAHKLLEGAKVKAHDIVSNAWKKAALIIEDRKRSAEKEGLKSKERQITLAKLKARDVLLASKQHAIDKAFALTMEKIKSMDDLSYGEFMEKLFLDSVEIGDEEVILSMRDRDRIESIITDVNEKLTVSGKKGSLKISNESRDISAGFILKSGDVEINCSIDYRVKLLRDSLEGDIYRLLFGQ